MSKDVRVQQAIDNWDEYVAYLETFTEPPQEKTRKPKIKEEDNNQTSLF